MGVGHSRFLLFCLIWLSSVDVCLIRLVGWVGNLGLCRSNVFRSRCFGGNNINAMGVCVANIRQWRAFKTCFIPRVLVDRCLGCDGPVSNKIIWFFVMRSLIIFSLRRKKLG